MNTLIKNGKVLIYTDNQDEIKVENLDILIQDGKILRIEENINENELKDMYVIDATNKVVMPGLINCHIHLPMSIFRETTEGCSLMEWLTDKIWPIEDRLTEEDVYYATLLSCIEAISTGTTCVSDHYFLSGAIRKALEKVKIRAMLTRVLMDVDGNGESREKEFMDLYNSRNINDDLIKYTVSPHALYTCSGKCLEDSAKIAKENNLIVHTHFLESINEIEDNQKMHGMLSREALEKYFKNNKMVLAHGVKLDKEDIEVVKKLDCTIVHNPASNMRLGCKIADVTTYNKEGLNVALGTDGQGSGNNLDMFEVMKMTGLLQGGIHENEERVSAENVIRMATINGAKAYSLDDKIGTVEVGKDADLIIVNLENKLNNIKMLPYSNLVSNLVYNVNGLNVDTTIVKGNILMEDRKMKNIDVEEVISKCKDIVSRLMNK